MGERRKRKSAWEEDDTKHMSGMNDHNSWTEKDHRSSHGSGHYHEVSESRTHKSRDNSGWPAWESIEEHPNAPTNSSFKNSQDGKEFGGGKRYNKNMSPGIDEMEVGNYDDTHEYDQSRLPRYPGRGRSRSRSRSLSRGREREREREREKRRSRSRSRSRAHVKTKDYTRIRSPINARHSYERSDRRGGVAEKSSQICRDFSAGNCRRGSQCRFYHPNTSGRRDRDIMEDDPSESWRSRTDYNRGSRHSYSSRASSGFESRHDVSDPYHDDRRALPCKDFLKGNCRWGDTCRFSHSDPSDDGYGHGTGSVSSDKGRIGKPLCKFFAAGKCSRENCWFSHEEPNNNDRRGVLTTERRSHDKSNRSNGPTWDDPTAKLDDGGDGSWGNENKNWGKMESTLPGESGSYGRNTGIYEPNAKENENDNGRRGVVTTEKHSHDKSSRWNGPTWDDAATKIDDRGDGSWDNENKNWGKIESTLPGESGSYGRNTGFYDPIAKESENKNCGKIGSTFPRESGSSDRNTGFYEPVAKENDNKNWGNAECTPGESGNYGRNTSLYEPIAKENENKPRGEIETTFPGESGSSGRNTGFYEPIAKENENKNWGKRESTFHGESGSPGRNAGFYEPISKENENKNWGEIENTFPTESGSSDRNTDFYEPIANENENKNWGKTESTFPGVSSSSGRNTGFYEPIAKENENKKWGEIESVFPAKSGNCGRNTAFYEPIAKENTDNKQENLILYGSELQDHDGIENVDGENALQQKVYPASHIQQQHYEAVGNNEMNSFGPDVRDDVVKETTTHLIPSFGHQNAVSVFPGRVQNMLLPNSLSNGFCADLNEPNTDMVDPLNVQIYSQTSQKAYQTPGFLEAKVPELLASLLTKKLSDQVTNSQSFVNEHSQTYTDIPSIPEASGGAPLENTSNVQINSGAIFIDLNSIGNGRENTEHVNLNLAHCTEHNSRIQLKQSSSPLPVVGTGFDSSKVRREDVIANSQVAGDNKAVGDENKGIQENKRSENQNGHDRGEEAGGNRDEKGMRLFKNNLVEFVKEILKPAWKEGRMSRDDHKTVVKKVVDKVSSTIPVEHIPKTQEKVDQYLAFSKPKITKLVQAYVERFPKKDF